MRHLTPAEYIRMPWANGRGETIEMLKEVDDEGHLLWRLSVATVSEDGPFSLFAGIERVLTVIDGKGFDLTGEGISVTCAPLVPVAFPGDVAVKSERTRGKMSRDLNVMTARRLPRPEVAVVRGDATLGEGGTLCLYALESSVVDGEYLAEGDLMVIETGAKVSGVVLAARLFR